MVDGRPNRQQLLNAVHQLIAMCTAEDLTTDNVARLRKVTELLEKARRSSTDRASASADVTLVEDLERIYQRVLDEADGKRFRFSADPFSRVRDAALAWANATGNHNHDALTQRRLEELDLDANEIVEKGSLRLAQGTAKHAAIVMAERIFEVPERTSYDRRKKGIAGTSDDHDPQTEDEELCDAERATAFALESTIPLTAEEARVQAKCLHASLKIGRQRR